MEYSQQQNDEITRKIVQLVNNSQLRIDQDLTILEAIIDKYKFRTIPNYSKDTGKSKTGLYNKVGRDDFAHKSIDGVPFVIPSLL